MTPLLIGSDCDPVRDLAAALGAEMIAVPEVLAVGSPADIDWNWAETLEDWRVVAAAGPAATAVVVAVWSDDLGEPADLGDLDVDGWVARHEVPFARWFAAMGVAASRCADRGAIVAVVEQSAPLDCAGRAAETALGEAVQTLARSLARSEGLRAVRVNAVTTPTRLTPAPTVEPPPPLASFPGSVTIEVAGAVRTLLGPDALGITATTVHADSGRWGL